ncbi:MAG: phosphoribosylanthranilate isomerase [Candidatus Omnitrophota bacterium]
MSCKIKICGLSSRADMEMAAWMGADYGGILIDIDSIRAHPLKQAADLFVSPPLPVAAVTQDKDLDGNARTAEALAPAALQLHGFEPPELVCALKSRVSCEIWKAMHLPASESGEALDLEAFLRSIKEYAEASVDRFVIDASCMEGGRRKLGGTGKTVDWRTARWIRERSPRPMLLAGGLNPENVAEAVTAVQPYGVDLSSGVESVIGKKDPDKVLLLIARVRALEGMSGIPRIC